MLEVKNLSVRLLSDKLLLNSINFKLNESKIYTILGKNGEGKSILLKSLTGLLNRNIFNIDGEIIIDGLNTLKANSADMRKLRKNSIRYVLQDAVGSFDPLKKINYYFEKPDKETWNIFDELLLTPADKILNSFPYELSVGQCQRLAFALGILAKPRLLILDEPTSALDHLNANIFLNVLKNFIRVNNASVLLVTHDIKFAEIVSDEVARLKEGNLSEFRHVEEHFKLNLN
ncbi:MAG: ABC transporter ATP-binding protein [Melioribacteraceae bacterium]|nr:ABC transporter ATP-binding protein [Melioribacteraceae bacterium]